MGRKLTILNVTSSLLGTFIGISAFIVFFWVYENLRAGTWAAFSGVFSGICLLLNVLHLQGRLEIYYSPSALGALESLGFVVLVNGLAFMIWYIFETIYYHIPMLPVKESLVECAVFAFITAKWGLSLFLLSRRYSKIMQRNALLQ